MKKDQGFIKWIVIIVIALIILGYYGISVRDALNAPTTQENLGFFKESMVWVWNHILRVPVMFIWNNLLLPLIHTLSGLNRG